MLVFSGITFHDNPVNLINCDLLDEGGFGLKVFVIDILTQLRDSRRIVKKRLNKTSRNPAFRVQLFGILTLGSTPFEGVVLGTLANFSP